MVDRSPEADNNKNNPRLDFILPVYPCFFVDIIRIMMFLHATCTYYELLRFEFIQKKSGIQTLSGIGAKQKLGMFTEVF